MQMRRKLDDAIDIYNQRSTKGKSGGYISNHSDDIEQDQ